MPLNVRIKPFRDYDEHDVINLFALDLASGDKGTIVTPLTSWNNEDNSFASPVVPGNSYANTVSNRWSINARVTTAGTGTAFPLGILLYDVREVDENGEALLFRPTKLDEMQAVLSGQAVPIITRGLFLISGTFGTPHAGSGIFVSHNGTFSATGNANAVKVGTFLGDTDSHGYVLCKLNFPN